VFQKLDLFPFSGAGEDAYSVGSLWLEDGNKSIF
jgi:hypothetical protein